MRDSVAATLISHREGFDVRRYRLGVQHDLRIGTFTPAAPVVLAPMAGVTNAPFRSDVPQFAPGWCTSTRW